MFILHGAFEKGSFVIWAEKEFQELAKPRGRQIQNPPPKPHPFAADKEDLVTILDSLGVKEESFFKGLIWLPSQGSLPIPSNPVLGSFPQVEDIPSLRPWAIWTCSLTPNQTIELIQKTEQIEKKGKEFAFLQGLFHFAVSLVSRQRYLPSLREKDTSFEAYWTPIFLGQDKVRFSLAEAAMPSLCRAWVPSLKHMEEPNVSPKLLLEGFLGELLDFLVRKSFEKKEIEKAKKASSVHDLWIRGLLSEKQAVKMDRGEAAHLMTSIREWQSPIQNTLSSPFKLCLRVEEPEETVSINKDLLSASSPWNISYLLQAYDDQSLLVTIEDVWNPKGVKRKVLERPGFNPRQFVLNSLGIATGLCSHVESSLHEPIPVGFSLNSKDVSSFFVEEAPKLEEAGFGVICPNWWKKDKTKLSAKAKLESSPFQTKRKVSIWDEINMSWQVFLGDLGVSVEDLEQLVLLKEPMIKLRGEWILLNKEDLQKAIDFLKKKPMQPKNALDLLQMAAGVSKEAYGLPVEGVEATGWVNDFLESIRNNAPMQTLAPPEGFIGTLRPYQLRGYSWMSFLQQWQLGACLADDMGLGKTPQTLAMIMRSWKEVGGSCNPTLLICPTSLTGNWSREASKFVPTLPIHVHHGSDRKKGEAFAKEIEGVGLVITSYALLYRDLDLFQEIEWEGLILDEAQNIKNAQTKQTKAANLLKSRYRLALTGTPVENNVGDLWSLMHFLNPGYLGSQESFRKTFFTPIQLERNVKSSELLKNLTKPLVLRRLKTDRTIISDLPDKMEMKVYCSLTSEQISLYETVVSNANSALEKSEGIERKGIILATLSKLKQICNHPSHFLNDGPLSLERSGKLSRFQEMLEEIETTSDRALLFTQYAEMGHLLKKFLEEKRGKEVLFLHGGCSKKQRDLMVERFQQEDQGPAVFILSLKAGGVGLNLTRANHVFHFDRWWNPAIENQATDRAFRIGQRKNVQVHKFICSGTIEERIDEMIESKKEVADHVVGSGEGWLTELSTENLKELWKLQKASV